MNAFKLAITSILVLFVVNFCSGQNDTLAIRTTILNYVEGFYNADTIRMARAIHPELAKRIVINDQQGSFIVRNMGSSELLYNTKKNQNTGVINPDAPFSAVITIYDISANSATAKVVTNKFQFIDYVHLSRINGEWKIVNVLWEFA